MMLWIFGPLIIALIMYPFYAPMPKWRERQLQRKQPMKGRVIDIEVEVRQKNKERD